jgi:hypothetical protein
VIALLETEKLTRRLGGVVRFGCGFRLQERSGEVASACRKHPAALAPVFVGIGHGGCRLTRARSKRGGVGGCKVPHDTYMAKSKDTRDLIRERSDRALDLMDGQVDSAMHVMMRTV